MKILNFEIHFQDFGYFLMDFLLNFLLNFLNWCDCLCFLDF
ncbi:hypothetical protein BBUWI9123_J0048 (plasmid) [Borreliella burgdorferi WI91-23]|nr:hypothetical protein BBUWI9123_J0048 [Borreliella burgdorferi WI91-23]